MKHISMHSGGVASAVNAFRLVERYGPENVVLLFCDTKMEDEDLYRFNDDVSKAVGVPITTIADGRTPWEVYFDVRFLGNSHVDPCSKILKRRLSNNWVKDNTTPENSILYLGYYWDEQDRLATARNRYAPWKVESTLLWKPSIAEQSARQFLRDRGLVLPRLYKMGFAHNNCGGFCCKAGKKHFLTLLRVMPERYKEHERKEQEIRQYLGENDQPADVSILRHTVDGKEVNITLRELREKAEKSPKGLGLFEDDQASGCGCFTGGDDE